MNCLSKVYNVLCKLNLCLDDCAKEMIGVKVDDEIDLLDVHLSEHRAKNNKECLCCSSCVDSCCFEACCLNGCLNCCCLNKYCLMSCCMNKCCYDVLCKNIRLYKYSDNELFENRHNDIIITSVVSLDELQQQTSNESMSADVIENVSSTNDLNDTSVFIAGEWLKRRPVNEQV